MLDVLTERSLERESSVQRVQGFAKTLWMNPLVDEKTRDHRNRGRDLIPGVMSKLGLEGNYAGIPTGSFIYGADPSKSDYDIILLTRENARSLIGKHSIVDVVDQISLGDLRNGYLKSALSVLFTPDDFVFGESMLAQTMRLEISRIIDRKSWQIGAFIDRNNRSTPQAWLNRMYIERDHPYSSTPHEAYGKDVGYTRAKRYRDALQARASKEQNPEQWKEDFEKRWVGMRTPSNHEFHMAFESTRGALSLSSR